MAADKTHLRNTDKSYKLKKTDKKTTEGNTIYLNTETGEEHSEISVTLEYPENSGKWINVPSLLNGRVYNAKGVLAMLKKGKLVPTSTHMDEQTAVDAAVYRSTTLQSNTGVTLKASNELSLSTGIEGMNEKIAASVDKLDSMSAGEKFALNRDILKDKAENPDDYESVFASTFPTEEENPNGLFVRSEERPYISGNAAEESILAQAEAALASDQQTQRLSAIMDRANAEKDDSYFYENTDPMGRTSLVDKYRFGDLFKGLKRAENPEMNVYEQTPVSAADQAMFDTAYKQRNFPDAGPKTRQSKPEPITGSASAMDDSADIEAGMNTNYMMTDGPNRRQSNKPGFKFEYKPHMNPEQKMKDNRNIKGLTPAYGEMPGFKKAENGNYWSADENSEFWKTDAGYEKAQQTWGRSGGTLPNYVKRPKRKELDVEAIKNFFTPKASGY